MSSLDPVVEPPKKSSSAGCLIAAAIAVAAVMGLFLILAMVSFVFLPTFMESIQPQPGQGHPAIGRPLKTLKLVPLLGDAQPLTLPDLAGKVVLVNFWGTWCGPCLEEFPHIAALEQAYGDREGFRLLAVSCGVPGQKADLVELRNDTEAFLDEQGVAMPIYADPGAVTRSAVGALGAFRGYPTTIVLDDTGTVRGVWVGYKEGVEEEMESLIDRLLHER